jgi:predicted Zn-dependent protease
MTGEAIAELRAAVTLSKDSPTCVANLARAYVASGRRPEAEQLLKDLTARSKPDQSLGPDIAVISAALGDLDQAMRWLQRGYDERFNPGVLIRPGFDPLRTDPRFEALMHRVGFP